MHLGILNTAALKIDEMRQATGCMHYRQARSEELINSLSYLVSDTAARIHKLLQRLVFDLPYTTTVLLST